MPVKAWIYLGMDCPGLTRVSNSSTSFSPSKILMQISIMPLAEAYPPVVSISTIAYVTENTESKMKNLKAHTSYFVFRTFPSGLEGLKKLVMGQAFGKFLMFKNRLEKTYRHLAKQ